VSIRDYFPALDQPQLRDRVELVAVCDVVVDRAKSAAERYGAREVWSDFDAMVAQTSAEALVLLTPIPYHFAQGSAAIKAGKHVYVRVDSSDEEIARTKELLAGLGLAVSGVSSKTDFLQFDEAGRQAMIAHSKATVDLSVRLGADHATLWPGELIEPDRSRQEMLDAIVACLRPIVAYGAEKGVRIRLENHGDIGRNTDLMVDILETVDSPWLGITLHTARADSTGRDMAEVARIYGSRIFHLHLNDTIETPSGPECRAVGEGSLDWSAIFQALAEAGYDGYYNVELGGSNVDELISKSLAYLMRVLPR